MTLDELADLDRLRFDSLKLIDRADFSPLFPKKFSRRADPSLFLDELKLIDELQSLSLDEVPPSNEFSDCCDDDILRDKLEWDIISMELFLWKR